MGLVLGSITALRGLRAEFTPGGPENEAARAAMLTRRLTVTAVPDTDQARQALADQLPALTSLARLGTVTLADAVPTEGGVCPGGRAGGDVLRPGVGASGRD